MQKPISSSDDVPLAVKDVCINPWPMFLCEGLFDFSPAGRLCCANSIVIDEQLSKFENRKVRLAAHHLPADPIDPTRWGGGSCLWQRTISDCPAGHQHRPTWLYNQSVEGILQQQSAGVWRVLQANGDIVVFDLITYLVGHNARIACASTAIVENMRDMFPGKSTSVDAIGHQVSDLKDLLDQLQKIVRS
jgi:hypothetical protein